MRSSNEKSLLWSEEFLPTPDGQPNSKFWTPDLGDGSQHGLVGWGNHEREFYTTDSLVADNGLTITAAREQGQSPIEAYYGPAEWTSGKIHTNGKVFFKYGYLEISAKMPKGVGTWPALWLLGKNISEGTAWPACLEQFKERYMPLVMPVNLVLRAFMKAQKIYRITLIALQSTGERIPLNGSSMISHSKSSLATKVISPLKLGHLMITST
jgi:hypothetical protein